MIGDRVDLKQILPAWVISNAPKLADGLIKTAEQCKRAAEVLRAISEEISMERVRSGGDYRMESGESLTAREIDESLYRAAMAEPFGNRPAANHAETERAVHHSEGVTLPEGGS